MLWTQWYLFQLLCSGKQIRIQPYLRGKFANIHVVDTWKLGTWSLIVLTLKLGLQSRVINNQPLWTRCYWSRLTTLMWWKTNLYSTIIEKIFVSVHVVDTNHTWEVKFANMHVDDTWKLGTWSLIVLIVKLGWRSRVINNQPLWTQCYWSRLTTLTRWQTNL